MAGIRSGQRVIDLACGPGNATLPARVGAAGFVLGLDISPPMIETAQHWAQQHNLHNVEFRLIDDELHLDVTAASFDAATCMFGLMYMPDPVTALRVVRDALKPGGRLAVSTWASLERCSFFNIPLQIVRRHVEHPLLEMRGPNPCALPTTEALKQVFVAAGFADVETYTLDNPFGFERADAFWDDMSTIGWPLGFVRPSLSDGVVQAIHDDTIATLVALFPDGFPQVTSEVILAAGARAQ
jgi:ubiquinone/menaquinone biosynthesis C-methylase UbiE